MGKIALRKAAKRTRQDHVAQLTLAERCVAAVLLAERADALVGDVGIVSAYLPIGSEIDPLPLIERLARRGVRTALPHVTGRTSPMRFLEWQPGEPLVAGPMGLSQPDSSAAELRPDVILTPLLAFDAAGNRLGYGAGHFDKAFARLPQARRIGLAWSVQSIAALSPDSWDVPLHAIVTEQGIITP